MIDLSWLKETAAYTLRTAGIMTSGRNHANGFHTELLRSCKSIALRPRMIGSDHFHLLSSLLL